jgi:hypothetical protein
MRKFMVVDGYVDPEYTDQPNFTFGNAVEEVQFVTEEGLRAFAYRMVCKVANPDQVSTEEMIQRLNENGYTVFEMTNAVKW